MDLKLFLIFIFFQLLTTTQSSPDPNTCTECERTPSACRRISGLFTVTAFTEGTYNPVVEIPAPACNINITEFRRSNNYIGIKTKGNKGIINSYWGLGQPGQYYGAGARFSYDRRSGSCSGTCIYSEGPTTENIVVQILYYAKNPGISYEFLLPNHVSFKPYDGTSNSVNSRASIRTETSLTPTSHQSSGIASSSPSSSKRRLRFQRRHHRRHRNHSRTSGAEQRSFDGERYTGTQYGRSEGRPAGTSAQEAPLIGLEVKHQSRSQQRSRSYDYTGSRYGVHTLGGKGLSYTASNGEKRKIVPSQSSGRIINRYQTRGTNVRQAPVPQYVPGTGNSRQYNRQPQYQRLTARTSYQRGGNAVESFEGSPYTSITRPLPESQSRNIGGSSYRWKISGLTECSRTCGRGVQHTNIVCISTSNRRQVVVTSENCANSRKPRTQTVECNAQPCEPAWEAEDWSECSATCGSGTQTRTVECRQRFSASLVLKVSADQCGSEDKPAVAQQCEKGLCSTWRTGDWGKCSKECGGGQRTRNVYCVNQLETQIPNEYCSGSKPRETEPCSTNKCSSQWWLSRWSKECSSTCGQGVKRRVAVCMDDSGNIVHEDNCYEEDVPLLEETCSSDVGCDGIWFTGPWGKCSTKCGEGSRQRQVACIQKDSYGMEIVQDYNCDESQRPNSQEECSNTDCDAVWYISPWSKCSATCGDGVRTRETRCVNDNRPSFECVDTLKPHTQEVCSQSQCIDYQRTDRYVNRTEKKRQRSNKNRASLEVEKKGTNSTYGENSLVESRAPVESVSYGNEETEKETVDNDTNEKEEKPTEVKAKLPSVFNVNSNCKDKYYNCKLVAQSRLCSYKYYKDLCCVTCGKLKRSKDH